LLPCMVLPIFRTWQALLGFEAEALHAQ
jgi:hypothetical protein